MSAILGRTSERSRFGSSNDPLYQDAPEGFPWIVFYLEFETHVDVWRVLHAKRDMPAWLADVDD